MRLSRFFVSHPFESGGLLNLRDDTHHHISHVLRYKAGYKLRVFNGSQGEWMASVKVVMKRETILVLEQCIRPQDVLSPLNLYVPPIRPHRLAILLEKVTELGVTDIHFLEMDYVSHALGNPQKIQKCLTGASEQSERLSVPVFHPMVSLSLFLERLQEPLLWAYEHSSLSLAHLFHTSLPKGGFLNDDLLGNAHLARPPSGQNFPGDPLLAYQGLLIGPEGGFSPREVQALHDHPHVHQVSLGPSILRTETAAIVGLGLLSLRRQITEQMASDNEKDPGNTPS